MVLLIEDIRIDKKNMHDFYEKIKNYCSNERNFLERVDGVVCLGNLSYDHNDIYNNRFDQLAFNINGSTVIINARFLTHRKLIIENLTIKIASHNSKSRKRAKQTLSKMTEYKL